MKSRRSSEWILSCILYPSHRFLPYQHLTELEKEEELREQAGEYDSDEESEDEEMQEIRQLAKQIREKRKMKIMESKEKDIHGPRLPRTAKKVSLHRIKHLDDIGVWKHARGISVRIGI